MYYTVIKHSGHLGTLEKCRKHSPAARVFYISLVFANAHRVLSQCNTRLRLLYLLNRGKAFYFTCTYLSCMHNCKNYLFIVLINAELWEFCYFFFQVLYAQAFSFSVIFYSTIFRLKFISFKSLGFKSLGCGLEMMISVL